MRWMLVLLLAAGGLGCDQNEDLTEGTAETCSGSEACASRLCVIQAGNTQGVCARGCSDDDKCPDDGTVCVSEPLSAPACLVPCAGIGAACPAPLSCQLLGNAYYCLM